MRVYVNKITGIDDAIVSMYFSKRSWTRKKEVYIRDLCDRVLTRRGELMADFFLDPTDTEEFNKWMETLTKWGRKHPTLLRFIDISVTVEGLHRAGQDDWDSHAKRFDNRIIRSSTRLADFKEGEMSEFYKDKIIPTDLALTYLGIEAPAALEHDGKTYVKTVNGYIWEGMQNNHDVKRGLYMLSIPSNFIFKVNLTEWSHVYKERNCLSGANPEVKECCEMIADQIEDIQPLFNRELFRAIPN